MKLVTLELLSGLDQWFEGLLQRIERRVSGDLFVVLWLGRDLLALVVIDLVSLGLNRSKKQLLRSFSNGFLSWVRSSFIYSVRICLEVGNSWVVIWVCTTV